MAMVNELIRSEEDGAISFGNHGLDAKEKLEGYEHQGDLFKVKTYKMMTKLEKNGSFLYESVPGTSVTNYTETEEGVQFHVEGEVDAQITIGLRDDTSYEVFLDNESAGVMKTNLSGKLNLSVELCPECEVFVKVVES